MWFSQEKFYKKNFIGELLWWMQQLAIYTIEILFWLFISPVMLRKEIVPASTAPRKISKIQFGAFTADDIQKIAEIQINSRDLYQMPQRQVAPHGCLDPHLGISDKIGSCQTCK